jgi:hypothetical protein
MTTSCAFASTNRRIRGIRLLTIAAFVLAMVVATVTSGTADTLAAPATSPTPTLSKRCKAIQWHIKDARSRALTALSSGNEAGYDDWMDHVYDLLGFGIENNCGLDMDGNVVE